MKQFFVTTLSLLIIAGVGKTIYLDKFTPLEYNGVLGNQFAMSSNPGEQGNVNVFRPLSYSQILYKGYVLQVVKIQPYFMTFEIVEKEK